MPASPSPRIVSLVPSATEALAMVGGLPLLVGRSHECDTPPGLEQVPVLTAPRTLGASPAEIDASVRDAVAGARSLYHLDVDRLVGLRPDVILTQTLCNVCSIDLASVERAVRGSCPGATILTLNPEGIEDVLDDVVRVAAAAGLADAGTGAVVALRERLFAATEFVNPYDDGPSVAFLEWTDPLYGAGHWTVQMIERAGGRHPLNPTRAGTGSGAASGPQVAQRLAGKSRRMSPDELVSSAPEWLVVCPCGVELAEALSQARALAAQPWWGGLPAVRAGRVAVVDGNQMFNRPGPRIVDAVEWLVGWLNERPSIMPPGFPWAPLA
ncbi:MAG: cobalamin-binding protein [Leptolyngbya sp. PLA1]|nr:cobalamin-binding protein [Leptolyngbya sp. PLA1]